MHPLDRASRFALQLLAALPLAAAAGTPINARTDAAPTGRVEVSNTAGSVQIVGWARPEVEASGELGKGTERLEFARDGDVVRVKVILPKSSRKVEPTDLVVKVPAGSVVFVKTVSADVVARGVGGTQRLETVSGNVRAETAGANVECRTVSGDVNLTGSDKAGLVSITTVSGNATATRVAGQVNASTVSGNLMLAAGETHRSRLRSTSGDVRLTAQLAAGGSMDIESISGDVRLDLAGTPGAAFDLSTMSGDIKNCFGPKPVRTDEYGPGRALRFAHGSAKGSVRIKTLSGDIDLCKPQP
jgi:hypothetical protein